MAARTKGTMGIDKSAAPAWVRVTIILVAVSFVVAFIPIVLIGGKSGGSGTTGAQATQGTSGYYQDQLDAALRALDAQPENPELMTLAGHSYYDLAVSLYEGGDQRGAAPYFRNAAILYDKVLLITPDDDVLLGNKAFALFYAGSADAPPAMQAFIAAAKDNASLSDQVQTMQQLLASIATTSSVPATTTP